MSGAPAPTGAPVRAASTREARPNTRTPSQLRAPGAACAPAASGRSHRPPRLRSLGVLDRWQDVLVEPEQIRGVVATLDRCEAVPGRPRVGVADPRLALVAEEADVCVGFALAQRCGEVGDPGLAHGLVLGSL